MKTTRPQNLESATQKRSSTTTKPDVEQAFDEERHRRIAEAAYYRAERRGFVPGGDHEDWLEAEKEIQAMETLDDVPPEDNAYPTPK